MSHLRWDQALALAVVVCGVLEHPRVCLCLAVSWLSWDTVIFCEIFFSFFFFPNNPLLRTWRRGGRRFAHHPSPVYAVLGIFPFLDKVVGPVARSVLLERRTW